MILFVLMYVKFSSVFKGGLIQNWNAFIQLQPQLEAADITIVAILLSLARMSGLKKMFAVIRVHVKTTFSYSNLHWLGIKHQVTYLLIVIVMTWQSALLKPQSQDAAVGMAGNTALVYITVWTGVGKWLHTLPSHPTPGEPQGLSWGLLTNSNNIYSWTKHMKGSNERRLLGQNTSCKCSGNPLYQATKWHLNNS